eukprot:3387977-Ditylum_brightwellii.AAC.1
MRVKLKSELSFKDIAAGLKMIELLQLLKDLSFNYQSQKCPFLSAYLAMRSFYLMHQKEMVPYKKYLEAFTNQKNVIEHIRGSVVGHCSLKKMMPKEAGIKDTSNASGDERGKATADAKEAYLAMAFLASANRAKYGRLLEELANNYLKGTNEYPHTM